MSNHGFIFRSNNHLRLILTIKTRECHTPSSLLITIKRCVLDIQSNLCIKLFYTFAYFFARFMNIIVQFIVKFMTNILSRQSNRGRAINSKSIKCTVAFFIKCKLISLLVASFSISVPLSPFEYFFSVFFGFCGEK